MICKQISYSVFWLSALLTGLVLFENAFLTDAIFDCQKGVVVETTSKYNVPSQSHVPVNYFATIKLNESGRLIEEVKYAKGTMLVKSDTVNIYSLDNGQFKIEKLKE